MRAYVHIREKKQNLHSALEAVQKVDGVKYASIVTGPTDIIAIVEAESGNAIVGIVGTIGALNCVASTFTYIEITNQS